jgi:hypothetical protein
VEFLVERRIREALERGELATPSLSGKPIDDLDVHRPPGWWADRFVERERERAREDASDSTREMLALWRSRSR